MKKCLEHLQSWYGCYCILLLAMVITILLGMTILLLNMKTTQNNGRYQIAGGTTSCWIIDTETSRLWIRYPDGGLNLGTNSEPTQIKMPVPEYREWDALDKLASDEIKDN